jgi:hypothetical protein
MLIKANRLMRGQRKLLLGKDTSKGYNSPLLILNAYSYTLIYAITRNIHSLPRIY